MIIEPLPTSEIRVGDILHAGFLGSQPGQMMTALVTELEDLEDGARRMSVLSAVPEVDGEAVRLIGHSWIARPMEEFRTIILTDGDDQDPYDHEQDGL